MVQQTKSTKIKIPKKEKFSRFLFVQYYDSSLFVLFSLQTTQQIIDDRKPFIDDLNATGLELMELCGDNDASEIQTKLVNVNDRFVKLKTQARGKLRELADARQNMTQEVCRMDCHTAPVVHYVCLYYAFNFNCMCTELI